MGFSILSLRRLALQWGTEKGRGRGRKGLPPPQSLGLRFCSPLFAFFPYQVPWSQARFSCARRATSLSATRCMSHCIRSESSLLQEVFPVKIGSNLISPPKRLNVFLLLTVNQVYRPFLHSAPMSKHTVA